MSRFNPVQNAKLLLVCGLIMLTAFAATAHEKAATMVAKTPEPANPAAEKALAVVSQLRTAINTGDAVMAERSMAENITIFEQGHAEKSRAEYLSHHFKEDVVFAKAVPSVVESSQTKVDGNIAVVTAFTATDGIYKDKPIKNSGVETYVLRLLNGRWQIEHIHWSSRKR